MTPSTNASASSPTLRFEDGAVQFRRRLALSILSQRPLLLRNIRADHVTAPGLRPHEASFLRLLDRMTNGTRIEINSSGTQLRFVPGLLLGGDIQHDCPVHVPEEDEEKQEDAEEDVVRSIGWYLEGILPLAPFGKEPLILTLTGITDGACRWDPSPDYWARSAMPLMRRFLGWGTNRTTASSTSSSAGTTTTEADFWTGPTEVSIRILRRGAYPTGGGRVCLTCPNVRSQLPPIECVDPGLIKRVRGTAVSCQWVSQAHTARLAFSAKGLLHRLLPDVWIHTDVVVHRPTTTTTTPSSKSSSSPSPPPRSSPSLQLVLTAESTTGMVLTVETCRRRQRRSSQKSNAPPQVPEDLGQEGAALLLAEISRGGCIDESLQSLAIILMCLTPQEDVSRLRLGRLTPTTVSTLRLCRQVLQVECKITADPATQTVLISCVGCGYRNLARAST